MCCRGPSRCSVATTPRREVKREWRSARKNRLLIAMQVIWVVIHARMRSTPSMLGIVSPVSLLLWLWLWQRAIHATHWVSPASSSSGWCLDAWQACNARQPAFALGTSTRVEFVCADVTDSGLLTELDGQVDLVVSNPPYVPDGAELEPEVVDHDPPHAVFGGPDGMAVIPAVARLAGRLLRAGGLFAVEHDDTTSSKTAETISSTELFDDIVARTDLTGRPRFVTARTKGGRS